MSDLDDLGDLPPPDDDDPSPVIRFVETLLAEAVRRGADVVHIEPGPDARLHVRFRVEGTLFEAMQVPSTMTPAVLARLKILADLDIAERRLPQDGRIRVRIVDDEAELALTTLPTVNGESAVLKRLDLPLQRFDTLEELGYDADVLAAFRAALERPGIVLLAGPTFSGRHTALYAALAARAAGGERTVGTAEAPVRRALPGVRQVNVNDMIGLGFAAVLRTLLRHDVQVIGLGEIMDFETAELAFSAANRGLQIVATIHTRSAASTVRRLLDMGLEPWIVSDGLSLVVAQRLLRKLCERCRVRDDADPATLASLGVPAERAARATLYRRGGCDDCGGTGYRGRLLVAETLAIDARARTAIRAREVPADAVPRRLRAAALARACDGLTTVEEVLLVTPSPADE